MTTIEEARTYTGTTPLSGLAQLVLLQHVSVDSVNVLEIGCGSLHFAKAFLAAHRHGATYSGMDPNTWLRDVARSDDPVLDRLCSDYDAKFSDADDFDGKGAFGHRFDLVFSHSVLSHCSHKQLQQFMVGAARSLWPGGMLVASVNIAKDDAAPTIGDEWTYPSGVTVSPGELRSVLVDHGFTVQVRPDLRELYMSWCPVETHDWIVVTKRAA
jgi:cyclopropane fatty-acyl-phospholipid synthase-like methyltransferase